MSTKWKIGLGAVGVVLLSAWSLLLPGAGARRSLEETRRALRQQGFKVELKEFDFSTSPESRARATALTNFSPVFPTWPAGEPGRRMLRSLKAAGLDLMRPVGANSALAMSSQDTLPSGIDDTDLWPVLRELCADDRERLDAAQVSLLSGPFSFDPDARAGNAMLLPHLAALKNLAHSLGVRCLLFLHEGQREAAWTNLLAATRLVTAWNPEPAEVSHLVRFAMAGIAFNASWQALEAGGWSDDQLAALQREWEGVDFFKALPETAAFMRASMVATCQLERQQPVVRPSILLADAIGSPWAVWYGLKGYWQQLRYRRLGTYEDERSLLLHYRDREVDLRRAGQCATWSEMRAIAGATNLVHFQSRHSSLLQMMINSRQLTMAWSLYNYGQGQQSRSLLGRAAETEARRRIIVAALALERRRVRQGSYPDTLQELVPGLLKQLPVDFMDGGPLRYRRTEGDHFVLYSTGLDCVDDGGVMPRRGSEIQGYEKAGQRRVPEPTDLVWPCPASAAEIAESRRARLKAAAEIHDRNADAEAAQEWQLAATRQAGVERILAEGSRGQVREATYQGRALHQLLRNPETTGTNRLSLRDLLKLETITTGAEPETVTFETPIDFQVLTNLASLQLLVDYTPGDDSDFRYAGGQIECRRATNGNCLVVWRTIYESPGRHALRLGLELNEPEGDGEPILGPVAPFVVGNLCQFSVTSATFDPRFGATLRAKLPEPNGACTATIVSPAGDRLKSLTASTTNGILKLHWDLNDEQGRRCTNEFFDTVFQITLPDSGRSQMLKGP